MLMLCSFLPKLADDQVILRLVANMNNMIRFFRQFRQRLLAKNRFTQYIFYALGEIVLVVIGILLAENLSPALKGGFS